MEPLDTPTILPTTSACGCCVATSRLAWNCDVPTSAGKVSYPVGSAQTRSVCLRMAEQGAGIATVTHAFVHEALARGDLVQLLPEWQAPSQTAWAVMPSPRSSRQRRVLSSIC
ncbi:MAG: hypothetical protein KF710_10730 [Rhodocyclaceae bacterium]|nr:hypothetical protein [Rhodocyclaceae bacterium]